MIQLTLEGDSDDPGASWCYGTGPGWYARLVPAGRALAVTDDPTKDMDPTPETESGVAVAEHEAEPDPDPPVTGSRGGDAALASLLTALVAAGLITGAMEE